MCAELPSIPNGEISYNLSGVIVSGPAFADDTVATYSCNSGYILKGAAIRNCNVPEGAPEGEFDGVQSQCVRKYNCTANNLCTVYRPVCI